MQAKQGRAVFGVDMKIVGDDGQELPHDGKAVGRAAGARALDHLGLLQGRGRRPAGRTAGSPPATSRPSTPTASCRSPTAARTSSSPAASGSAPSTWRTSRWRTRPWRWRPASRARHPKWDERPLLVVVKKPGAEADARRTDRASTTARSPSGGRPTTWCSSSDPAGRHRQGAEEQAARAVPATIGCRRPDGRMTSLLDRRLAGAQPHALPGRAGLRRGRRGGDLPVASTTARR